MHMGHGLDPTRPASVGDHQDASSLCPARTRQKWGAQEDAGNPGSTVALGGWDGISACMRMRYAFVRSNRKLGWINVLGYK